MDAVDSSDEVAGVGVVVADTSVEEVALEEVTPADGTGPGVADTDSVPMLLLEASIVAAAEGEATPVADTPADAAGTGSLATALPLGGTVAASDDVRVPDAIGDGTAVCDRVRDGEADSLAAGVAVALAALLALAAPLALTVLVVKAATEALG